MKKNRKLRLEYIEYQISEMRDRVDEIQKGSYSVNKLEELVYLNGEIVKLHREEHDLRSEIANDWMKISIGIGLSIPIFIAGFILRD